MLEMFIPEFAAAARMPRRSKFPLRVALSAVGALMINYGLNRLFGLIPYLGGASVAIDAVHYIVQFAVALAVLPICFRMNALKCLFIGSVAWFIQHLVFDFLSAVWGLGAHGVWAHIRVYLILAAFTAALWFLFLRKITDSTLDKIPLIRIVVTVVIVVAVCVVINLCASFTRSNTVVFYLSDLASNAIGLIYMGTVLTLSVMKSENEKTESMLRQSVSQYNAAKANAELINIKCHDLRHQIRLMREKNCTDEYIDEMERIIDDYDCSLQTGNGALNVLLTEKTRECKNKRIRFTCMADGNGLSYMRSVDVYALFGNALENAIEAAEAVDESERYVNFTLRPIGGFYSVHIQNATGRTVVFGSDGLPVTHKQDKENHGYGIRSMRLIVEKYGGEITYNADGRLFNLNIILPYKSELAENA